MGDCGKIKLRILEAGRALAFGLGGCRNSATTWRLELKWGLAYQIIPRLTSKPINSIKKYPYNPSCIILISTTVFYTPRLIIVTYFCTNRDHDGFYFETSATVHKTTTIASPPVPNHRLPRA